MSSANDKPCCKCSIVFQDTVLDIIYILFNMSFIVDCELYVLFHGQHFFPFQYQNKSLTFSRANMSCWYTFTFSAEEHFVMNHKKDRRGLYTVLLLWIELRLNFIGVVWENKMGSLPSALDWRVWVSLASSSFLSHPLSLLLKPQVNSSPFVFFAKICLFSLSNIQQTGQHRKYKKWLVQSLSCIFFFLFY